MPWSHLMVAIHKQKDPQDNDVFFLDFLRKSPGFRQQTLQWVLTPNPVCVWQRHSLFPYQGVPTAQPLLSPGCLGSAKNLSPPPASNKHWTTCQKLVTGLPSEKARTRRPRDVPRRGASVVFDLPRFGGCSLITAVTICGQTAWKLLAINPQRSLTLFLSLHLCCLLIAHSGKLIHSAEFQQKN